MSKILCWQGETMWDNCIARAVQVSPCKGTACQQGLRVTCLTHGSSVLHLRCEKLTETWEFCIWPRCSLGCDCVCGQTQAHFAGSASSLAARVCRAQAEAVLGCLIGHVGRQAVTAWPSGRADTGFRVETALLQPAGSRISQEDSHFYWWLVATEMIFVLPGFVVR